MARQGSPQSEGISRHYTWTPICNLPKVLGIWAGPCWLETGQCYTHLQKGHDRRPRKTLTSWFKFSVYLSPWKRYRECCPGEYLNNKAVGRHSQHGSIKEKSYLSNLIFYDKVTCLADEGKTMDVIFLDFSKAFDTLTHSILLDKLSNCETNRFILHCVKNHLSGKAQMFIANGLQLAGIQSSMVIPKA